MTNQIHRVLSTLNEKGGEDSEDAVGIGEKHDHTLEEVGQDFKTYRERIRQIEDEALRKLKHSSRVDKLRNFIE